MAKIDQTLVLFKEIIDNGNISLSGEGIPKKPIRKLIQMFKDDGN